MTELAPAPRPVPVDVDMFELLADAGAFSGLGRIELRDGVMVEMAPQWTAHGRTTYLLTKAVDTAIERAALPLLICGEVSVRLARRRMPLPDIVVAAEGSYPKAIPVEAVRLLIEVASSSLDDDLGWKLRVYAEAALAEYWVADVENRLIRHHRSPRPEVGDYAATDVTAFGQPAPARTIPDLVVDTSPLLTV